LELFCVFGGLVRGTGHEVKDPRKSKMSVEVAFFPANSSSFELIILDLSVENLYLDFAHTRLVK
jgi:hypothetical protein